MVMLVGVAGLIFPFFLNLHEVPEGDMKWALLASLVETLPSGILPLWLGSKLIRAARAKSPGVAPAPFAVEVQVAPAALATPVPPPPKTPLPAPEWPPSVRPRRPWLAHLGLGIALLGLPLFAIAWYVAFAESTAQNVTQGLGIAIVTLAASLPFMLGLWLAHTGDPDLSRRFRDDVTRGLRAFAEPSGLRRFLGSSPGLGLAMGLGSLILMYTFRPLAGLVALGALCAFALADPLLLVWRPKWWLGAILSVAVWLILLTALVGTADTLNHMGDDTMVYLLPFTIYPGALVVSGFVRLFLRLDKRAPPPPPTFTSTGPTS